MPIALCPAVSRCGLGGVLVPAVSGGGMGCVRICQAVARPSQPINAPKTAKKGLKKSLDIIASECARPIANQWQCLQELFSPS